MLLPTLRQRKEKHLWQGYNFIMRLQKRYLPLVTFSILALLVALWAGLLRIGWSLPSFPKLVMAHGPLMVCGFLGTLIPLERAVAIRQKWMFAAPILTALGWVTLLISPTIFGAASFTLGSLITLAILLYMFKQEPKIHMGIMTAGSFAWVVGNILWMTGMPIFKLVFWWMAFLVLTIAGERLELSRILRPTPRADPVLRLFHCHYPTWSRNHRRQLRSWHPPKRARTSCSRNLVRPQRHRHPQSAPFHATDTLYRILPVCRVSMVDRRGWVNAWARRAGSGSVLRCDIAHRLRWLCYVDDLWACPYHFPGHRSGPNCF